MIYAIDYICLAGFCLYERLYIFGRMKILKVFFVIIFSFSLLLFTIAVDNKDAGELWLSAYSLYEKAEQYYNSEDYSSSFVYYQKALKKFNDLHGAYPDWNSELVSYRITYCEEKEAIINSKLRQGNMDKSSDELIKENIELQTRLADYQDKLANEQNKLKDALSRREKNQGEFLKNNETIEKLKQVMKEKLELEKKYSLVSEGLGKGTFEDSNLIENLRSDMEQQRKKLESVLQEKQKIENEHSEFKKKYSNMVLQKADIDYHLKAEEERSKSRQSSYLQASKQIDVLSEEIKRLTVEKNNLAKKLTTAKISLQEEQQNRDNLKAVIENNSNGAAVELSKENSSLKKQLQNFQKEIDRLNGIKDSYSYELNKSKEIQAETAKTISSLQSKYSTVGEEIENLRKVINENEARESEYSKKITEMSAKLAESKEEYNLLTAKYKELEKKQDNLVAIQNRNLDLEREKRQLLEQIQNYQYQAEEAKKQIASIRNAKEKLEKEQAKLIRDNISSSLESESKYNQKVNDFNEASWKLKELEASNTMKERKLNELLKMQQELFNAKFVIDELRKTNSAQLKDVANFSGQLKYSNIKNQECEKIKTLTDKLEKAEKKEQHSEFLISLSEEKNISLNAKINEMEKARVEQASLIDSLQKQLEAVPKNKDKISLQGKLKSLLTQLNEINAENSEIKESLSKSEGKTVSIQKEYEKLLNKNMDIEKGVQGLNKQFMSVKNDLKEAKIRVKNLERINGDFQMRLLDEKNKTAVFQKDISEKTDIIKGLTKNKAELLRRMEVIISESNKLSKEKLEAVNKKTVFTSIADSSAAIIRDLVQKIENFQKN